MNSDTAEKVTAKIIKALEEGTAPWRKTWKSQQSYNIISGQPYSGANALFTHPMVTGYESPVFMTYLQAKSLGGSVKKGERGITITRPVIRKCKKSGKEFPGCKRYTVFNHIQTEGIDLGDEPKEHIEIPSADELIKHMKNPPTVKYGSYDPCYSPQIDTVFSPERSAFESIETFHETRFHEFGHATGHKSRLNRDLKPLMFDTHGYSKEELVAELTSAFCCHYVGIETELKNQAAYCASWLNALNNDRQFIIEAARHADKAFNMIKGESNAD